MKIISLLLFLVFGIQIDLLGQFNPCSQVIIPADSSGIYAFSGYNGKKGMIAIDQIRTVDKPRIVRIFENLTNSEIEKCKAVLKETFVD